MDFLRFVHIIEVDGDYKAIFTGEDEESVIETKRNESFMPDNASVVDTSRRNNDENKKKDTGSLAKNLKDEQRKKEDQEEDYRIMILKKRHISSVENIKIKKSSREIQRIFRGHIGRREYKILTIKRMIFMARLVRNIKRFLIRLKTMKDKYSYVIYYFFSKQAELKTQRKQLESSSRVFLKNKDPSRNFAAYFLQCIWRKYIDNKRKIKLKSKAIANSLIKSKTCIVCKKFRVTKICLKCEDNHYCDGCFEKYHSHGVKRNHEFSKVVYENLGQKEKEKKTALPQTQKKIFTTFKDEAEILNEKFRECDFNVLDHIQMWDHDKRGVITHQRLKEAFSFRFFNFGSNICDTILNLAYRFTIKHSKLNKNEDVLIDYVEMCKSLFNKYI